MADPITTLLVLYFITPATNKPDRMNLAEKREYEAQKVWTLQSTSQIPTENPNMCVAVGTKLIEQFIPLSTVTVRAYCLCPEQTAQNDACFNQKKADEEKISKSQGIRPQGVRPQGVAPTTSGTIVPLGPLTRPPNTSGPPAQ